MKKDFLKNISKKVIKKISLLGFLIGLFLSVVFYTFFSPNYYPQTTNSEIVIRNGEVFKSTIKKLYRRKIIPSKSNFYFLAKLLNAERNIKAGYYKIPNGLSYFELLRFLINGQPEPSILITIPEGIWQHDVAKLFKRELNLNVEKFLQLSKNKSFIKSLGLNVRNLEGYLLPDTYYFKLKNSERNVIKKLVNETLSFFNSERRKQIKKMGLTIHQVLTLASIVDGETNNPNEFKKIAGVYLNRLKRGMKLQADPTIQYLIRNRKKHNKIYFKDLEKDSPYNTYLYKGLPPSPINNPGKEAILSVIYPEKNNFLYFVADGNGNHKFSKTYSEHLKNVRAYRKARRKK